MKNKPFLKTTRTLLMRPAIYLLLAAASIFCAVELEAAPSNGTRMPSQKKVELGYEYNIMFKRALRGPYGDVSTQDSFYTVSFGAFDWLALDGKIGIGNIMHKAAQSLPKVQYNTGFAGGYGFRIKAFDYKPLGLRAIIGAQHISVHPRDRSVNDEKYESFLDDWQVSALFAKDIRHLTVYAGMKGSDCEMVYKVNYHDKTRRYSKNHIGLITGLELYLFGDKARAAAEARFFDETAFSASASYLF